MNSHHASFRRKATRVLAFVVLTLTVRPGNAAQRTLTLARDGKPEATIIVAKSAGHIPWFAAGELQYHVRKITGATLPILTDDAAVQGTRL